MVLPTAKLSGMLINFYEEELLCSFVLLYITVFRDITPVSNNELIVISEIPHNRCRFYVQ
jgi:hypothetical protein